MPSRKWSFWAALAVAGFAGLVLIALASTSGLPHVIADLLNGLGTAAIVAAILGATVDAYLKVDLLRDAFKALFGYLLPAQLRSELAWITEQDLLCEDYALTLTLTGVSDPSLLTVRMEQRRTIRNVSNHVADCLRTVAVDEWFHDALPSRVLDLRCTHGDVTHTTWETEQTPFAIAAHLIDEISLAPEDTAILSAQTEETRHRSDAFYLHALMATANPRVTVHAPEGIEWNVMFANRAQAQVRHTGADTRELPGTLLPGHVIQVRWWPKDREERWEAR